MTKRYKILTVEFGREKLMICLGNAFVSVVEILVNITSTYLVMCIKKWKKTRSLISSLTRVKRSALIQLDAKCK